MLFFPCHYSLCQDLCHLFLKHLSGFVAPTMLNFEIGLAGIKPFNINITYFQLTAFGAYLGVIKLSLSQLTNLILKLSKVDVTDLCMPTPHWVHLVLGSSSVTQPSDPAAVRRNFLIGSPQESDLKSHSLSRRPSPKHEVTGGNGNSTIVARPSPEECRKKEPSPLERKPLSAPSTPSKSTAISPLLEVRASTFLEPQFNELRIFIETFQSCRY